MNLEILSVGEGSTLRFKRGQGESNPEIFNGGKGVQGQLKLRKKLAKLETF